MRSAPLPTRLGRAAAAQVSSKRPTSIILRDRHAGIGITEAQRRHIASYGEWQGDAKMFARQMGVVRFTANVTSGACGRCDLLVEEQTSDGDWTETANAKAKGLMAEYGNELLGQNAGELVRLHAWHYNVAGEGAMATFDGSGQAGAEWLVASLDALEWDQPQKGQATLKLHPTGTVREGTALVIPRDYVLRFWTPDEEWLGLAVSPMTAAMADLYRYRALIRHARRQADNYLAMNGVLWTPQEAHETETGEQGIDADEPQHDRTAETYNEWASTSIAYDDDLRSVIPPMWWWEGNTKPEWVEIGRPFDEQALHYRAEALTDWARAVDLPASLVTGGGPGDKNHWVEWLVDEKFFKSAVAPTMDKITHQDLTVAYLRPRLRLIGLDPEHFRVGYDPTPVIVHPDASDKALRGWLAGLVGAVPALRAMGFDPEALASEEDLARLAKVLQGFASGAPGGPLGPGMPPGIARSDKSVGQGNGAASTVKAPPPGSSGVPGAPPAPPRAPAAALLASMAGLEDFLPPTRAAAALNGGSNGVMVSLPAPVQSEALPDGESPDDLHMTLLHLGKADELDPSIRGVLSGVCAALAADNAPPEVELTHLERFTPTNDEGLEPCAMVDAGPDCMELHQRLATMATAAGLPVADDHAFRAHVTLGYYPPDEGPPAGPLPQAHAYAPDALHLHWGDQVDRFPFVEAPESGAHPPGAGTDGSESPPLVASTPEELEALWALELAVTGAAGEWDESLHPRGEHGKFGHKEGGGTALDSLPGPYPDDGPEGDAFYQNVLALQKAGQDDEASAMLDSRRQLTKAWEKTVGELISTGQITPDDARARWGDRIDWLGQHMGGSGSDRPWEPLPAELWHVTTAAPAVEASGRLMTRDELDMAAGTGLGGGASNTISFTDSPETAVAIRDAMLEARDVAAGNKTVADMVRDAETGAGAHEPYAQDLMRYWNSDWRTGDPYPKSVQQLLEDPERDTPADRLDFYKNYSTWREFHGGPLNPLFFLTDADALAKKDPSDIAVVRAQPVPGAQGVQVSALGEWRVPTGRAVNITGIGQTAAARVATWDPSKHPKDAKGLWAEVPDDAVSDQAMAAELAREHAAEIADRVERIEPEVTADLHEVLPSGAELAGLDFRIKGEGRLAEKLEDKLGEGMSPDQAVASIKDALRYTVVDEPHDYVSAYAATVEGLESRGYEQVEAKNYWAPGDAYDGLNTVWKAPDGTTFELQFHTPQTHELKENQHPEYQRFRSSDDEAERAHLWANMLDDWEAIHRPPGVERIGKLVAAAARAAALAAATRYYVLVDRLTHETEARPGALFRLRTEPEGLWLELYAGKGRWVEATKSLAPHLFGEEVGAVSVDEARALELEQSYPWEGARAALARLAVAEWDETQHPRGHHGQFATTPDDDAVESAGPTPAVAPQGDPPTAAEWDRFRYELEDPAAGAEHDTMLAALRTAQLENLGYYPSAYFPDTRDGVQGLAMAMRSEYDPDAMPVPVFVPISTDHFYVAAGQLSDAERVDTEKLGESIREAATVAAREAEGRTAPADAPTQDSIDWGMRPDGIEAAGGNSIWVDSAMSPDRQNYIPGSAPDRRLEGEVATDLIDGELAARGIEANTSATIAATGPDWRVGLVQVDAPVPEGVLTPNRTDYDVLSGVDPGADPHDVADAYEIARGETERRLDVLDQVRDQLPDEVRPASEVRVADSPGMGEVGELNLPWTGMHLAIETDESIHSEAVQAPWRADGTLDVAAYSEQLTTAYDRLQGEAETDAHIADGGWERPLDDDDVWQQEFEAEQARYGDAYATADAAVQSALPENFYAELEQDGADGRWLVQDPDGNEGYIQTSINGNVLDVGLMEFDESMQGSGIGTAIAGALVSAAEQMGAAEIQFYANISVGGYAWARMGAYPTDSAWEDLKNTVAQRLEAADAAGLQVPDRQRVNELLAGPPTGLPDLAALDTKVTVPDELLNTNNGQTWRLDENGQLELGKALLLGTSWTARMSVGDTEAKRDFAAYAQEKEAETAQRAAAIRGVLPSGSPRIRHPQRRHPIGAYRGPDGLLDDGPFWAEALGEDIGARTAAGEWDETLHPRAEHGRFGHKDGGIEASSPEAAAGAALAAQAEAVGDNWGVVDSDGSWGDTTLSQPELTRQMEAAVTAIDASGHDGLDVSSAAYNWSMVNGIEAVRDMARGSDAQTIQDVYGFDEHQAQGVEGLVEIARETEHPEPLFRQIQVDTQFRDFRTGETTTLSPADIAPGKVIDNLGASSWSRDQDAAGCFGNRGVSAMLEVRGAHGIDVAAMVSPQYAWQREVIAVDPAYRVLSVADEPIDEWKGGGSRLHVVVEPVAQVPAMAAATAEQLSEALFGKTFGQESVELGHPAPARDAATAVWDPALHPRAEHGRFGEKPDAADVFREAVHQRTGTGAEAFDNLHEIDPDYLDLTVRTAREQVISTTKLLLEDRGDEVKFDDTGFTLQTPDGEKRQDWDGLVASVAGASSGWQSPGNQVCILATPETALEIAKDGRFQNQFESGDSSGLFNPDLRRNYEGDAMGVDRDTALADRPIYGTFGYDSDYPGAVGHYGSVVFDLKDSVAQRSTMTLGDSLDNAVPVPMRATTEQLDQDRLLAMQGANYRMDALYYQLNELTGTQDFYSEEGDWKDNDYPEAQIHGGVSMSDVESVFFNYPGEGEEPEEPSPELTAELDRRGIPWSKAW